LGVWLVGARGAISTCVVHGVHGLRAGLIEPVGLVTESAALAGLDFAPFDALVFGGHDVCLRDLSRSTLELQRQHILPPKLVESGAAAAHAHESRIAPGILDQCDVGLADLDPRSAALSARAPREQIAALVEDLRRFREAERLERVVVVHLASAEAARPERPEWRDLAAFERSLDAQVLPPASVLYAYAAIAAGSPFVNFTPNLGASIPALRQLARERGVAHCGNDGKTGETLVKTVLAPMFRQRALRVLAWQGYNMLGNRDGATLADPAHKELKLRHKGELLKELLADPHVHGHVAIDYVPSLDDWKTAWDYIHFEGFLGAKMSLQFTWQGSDSALAAPLVLDLVRLVEYAQRCGESGELAATAPFFKAPLAGGSHDFAQQHAQLEAWARRHRG
jgi:myo-inositol-1-phosphate synthase